MIAVVVMRTEEATLQWISTPDSKISLSKWLIRVTQPTRGLRQHLNTASLLKSCGETQQVYGFILLWQSEIISNVSSASSKENEAVPASVYFGRGREAWRMINNQKPEDSFRVGGVCKSFTRYRVMNKLSTLWMLSFQERLLNKLLWDFDPALLAR